jgi:site-specific DNA-methyltransferase (adenine-specific)
MQLESTQNMPLKARRRAPDLDEKTWEVGRQKIIQGDCLAVTKSLPSSSIDVVVTSPPYNIGVAYNSYQDKQPRKAYLDWLCQVGEAISHVLRPNGSFFLNIGSTGSDPWIAQDVAAVFRKYFLLQNHVIWVKSISIGDDTVGHFKPITSKRFLNHNHESIFHFTKTGSVQVDRVAVGVPFKDKSNIARWGHKADRRCAGNVWFLPYETVKSRSQKFDHPAGFPVSLPERCIRLHGQVGVDVLDPFLGAGTTLVAAQRLGCKGIGIEIDPHYAKTALSRVQREMEFKDQSPDGCYYRSGTQA